MRRRWFDRTFPTGHPSDAIPEFSERLRGTPARLDERVGSLPRETVTQAVEQTWSIQENIGHLLDLEPLWAGRLDDFCAGVETLRHADLENRRTHAANHNAALLSDLLRAFRTARFTLVDRLERLSRADIERTALHPRLQQPMTVADYLFFVAEHDDHHLARITELLRSM